jgi:hypothetical protein
MTNSKQRSGSARPAQNIIGDADPLGTNSMSTAINGSQSQGQSQKISSNNTQIINTDSSATAADIPLLLANQSNNRN